MNFKMKYEITPRYLPKGTKRRSGILMQKIVFVTAHDTGNKNSTANGNVNYYTNSANDELASAHIFVDDKYILECIPALTSNKPEKAWHVLYQKPLDNILFGDDANDIAIGVEYCYGTNINSNEAYKRYVWVLAYICYKFNLDPKTKIIGHFKLDPERKTDPASGLKDSGRTYEQLLKDIVTEYNDCVIPDKPLPSVSKDVPPIQKEVRISVNGKIIDKKGVLINNSTYMPLREVGEMLGAKIGWKQETYTAFVNDIPVERGYLINSLTYVAVRDCAEMLGFKVDWDAKNEIVLINK